VAAAGRALALLMRGGIGRQYRSRAIIRRRASVTDGQGGWTEDHADLAFDVPCRRVAGADSENTIADQLQAEIDHVVYFLVDQDVQRGDQVVVDGYELVVQAEWVPSEPRYRATACTETQLGA
jgi:hypothetical protein